MMKKAKSERKKRSVTGKKSQAQISCAWLCRKVDQVWEEGPHALLAHILLNGAFGDADAQLEQFAPNALGAPQAIVAGHGFDQGHRLGSDFGFPRGRLWSVACQNQRNA